MTEVSQLTLVTLTNKNLMRHSPVLVSNQPNLTAGKTINNKHPYFPLHCYNPLWPLMNESGKTKPDANYFHWISVLHQVTEELHLLKR